MLSSRKLLVILKTMPEDSEFKNAFREDWSEDKYIQTGIVNELRLMRGDNAVYNHHEMVPVLLKSPRQQLAEEIDSEQKLAVRAGIMAQLHGIT